MGWGVGGGTWGVWGTQHTQHPRVGRGHPWVTQHPWESPCGQLPSVGQDVWGRLGCVGQAVWGRLCVWGRPPPVTPCPPPAWLRAVQGLLVGALLLSSVAFGLFVWQLHAGPRGRLFSASGGTQILAGERRPSPAPAPPPPPHPFPHP